MPDVTRVCGMHPRREGDELWLLGRTREELGASAAMRLGGFRHGVVPRTDPVEHAATYEAFCRLRDRGAVVSAHVCGRGGLALALAQLVLASGQRLDVRLDALETSSLFSELFSETTGRIVFTAAPADARAVRDELGAHGVRRLGVVGPLDSGRLRVAVGDVVHLDLAESALRERFEVGLAVA
jgi:phosphoribosylformylglycinamidine synthase